MLSEKEPDKTPSQNDEYVLERMSSIKANLNEINRYLYGYDGEDYQYLLNGVIACGFRVLTKDGNSLSSVRIIPVNEDQPSYVSIGLLDYAKNLMQFEFEEDETE